MHKNTAAVCRPRCTAAHGVCALESSSLQTTIEELNVMYSLYCYCDRSHLPVALANLHVCSNRTTKVTVKLKDRSGHETIVRKRQIESKPHHLQLLHPRERGSTTEYPPIPHFGSISC